VSVIEATTWHPRESRRATFVVAAIIVGLLGSGALVLKGTEAAFTASTSNNANSWTAGSVALINDASGTAATGTAMFTVGNLLPSSSASASQQNCLKVTYSGSTGGTAAPVKLYAASVSDAQSLASHIHLTVSEGSGGSSGFGDCTGWTITGTPIYDGTLASFNAKTDYAGGVGNWAPTAGAAVVYKFQYYLDTALATNTDQGHTTTTTFKWETQAGS
jgi:hypothetical protein